MLPEASYFGAVRKVAGVISGVDVQPTGINFSLDLACAGQHSIRGTRELPYICIVARTIAQQIAWRGAWFAGRKSGR